MKNYLTFFNSEEIYNNCKSSLENPNVSIIKDFLGDYLNIHYNPILLHDYSQDYLTFVALESGTFKLNGNSVSYSLDNGSTWTTLASNTNSPTVNAGDKILWKAELTPNSSIGIGTFSSTGNYNVGGNPMSLLYGDNFISQTSLNGKDYAFYSLFSNSTKLINVEKLSLLATTLATYCYQGMFKGCTSLTSAPQLPATTLATNCYYDMFYGCTSLTTAPQLPATTLATNCYYDMFRNCTSLTSAPQLPATTLADSCYAYMFQGCSVLTIAPQLPATALTENCYNSMFYNCTSLTSAPELPATTLVTYCYYYMFRGCTNLIIAPELPATTLANYCYGYMFKDCTSLTTTPQLPATTLATYCYYYMFGGCTSLTSVPQLPATTLEPYCYGYMFYNCTALTTAPVLPATTLVANNCYDSMFSGCTLLNYIKAMFTTTPSSTYTRNWVSGVASSGTFIKNSAATWNVSGVNGIPTNWTVQNAA